MRALSRWRSLPVRTRSAMAIAVVGVLVGVATAFALAARPAPPPTAGGDPTIPPTPRPTPTSAPTAGPTPAPSPTPPAAANLLGTDGRFTILLLGSDHRSSHPGHRTDAIIVVTVDPSTGRSAAFSVPRDTVRFPLPDGQPFASKVNAMWMYLRDETGTPGKSMKAAVAGAFEIEVDHFAFIGFGGVRQLVAAVGGVDVTLEEPYYDPYYWVTAKRRGWGLPAGTSHLDAEDALIFARSRKGDNDFGRARRQQLLVMAALERVRERGGRDIPKLLEIAAETVQTDLPLDRASDVYDLLSGVDLEAPRRTVFGPRAYAAASGSSFALKLDVCREWIAENFPPARPGAAWPEVAPSPSAAASAVPTPAPGGSAP